jgi:hypothetical protein
MSRVRDTGSSPGLASLASNQRYSDDQLAILQQAAAILNIPVTALPNTLRAASSDSSTPAASPDSSLSAAENHYGASASNPNAHQWSSTNNLVEDWNYGVPAAQAQSQSQMQPLNNGVSHETKYLLRTPGSPGCDILREFEEELSRPRPPNAPHYSDESTASLNHGLPRIRPRMHSSTIARPPSALRALVRWQNLGKRILITIHKTSRRTCNNLQ